MRELDLFGGREQVERRIREALKAALLKVSSDATELEKELNLRPGLIQDILSDTGARLDYNEVLPLLVALKINMDVVYGEPKWNDEHTRKFWEEEMLHDYLRTLAIKELHEQGAEKDMDMQSQTKRFEIWSLAMSLNPSEEPVPYTILMRQFIDKSHALISVTSADMLGGRFCCGFVINGDLHIGIVIPSEHDSDEVWRLWFRQVAQVMYYCMSGWWKVPCDEEAAYFAKVLCTQWDGTFSRIGRRPEPEEWTQLIQAPEKMLTLIRKLRHSRILLLGSYSGEGGKRLCRLDSLVRKRGLTPVIFGNLHGCSRVVADGEVRKEVLTVAKLSELVIVEDSEASGHLVELTDLENAKVKTAILRHTGMGSSILAEPFWKESGSFMKLFEYTEDTIDEVLEEVFAWHEETR